MRWTGFLFFLFMPFVAIHGLSQEKANDNTRLIILADMGNEPDEEQQMVHMLLNCNEFDLEGLIAVTGKFLHPGRNDEYRKRTHPELFHKLINAYEKDLPNLQKHAAGWPTPDYLRSIVASGQKYYGIEDVGEEKSSEGSELIKEALLNDDPRPIWIVVNAGSNTLAQALFEISLEYPKGQLDAMIEKIRIFENGAQDNAGAWICSEFPKIHWIRSNYQTYSYGGPGGRSGSTTQNLGPHFWEPYEYSVQGQNTWLYENAMNNHGELGKVYPERRFKNGHLAFMEGGGTIPWMGLVNKGLFSINHPQWGGWSGRFTVEKVPDFWSRHKDIKPDEEKNSPFYTYREASDYWIDERNGDVYEGDYVPIWRWRESMFNNFLCRMDWTIKTKEEANHHPIAVVDGDDSNQIVFRKALAGEELVFDASGSHDPDSDNLQYKWWIYQEAGTYAGQIKLDGTNDNSVKLTIPTGAAGKQIHLILEVKDESAGTQLFDFRRVVIDVENRVISLPPFQG